MIRIKYIAFMNKKNDFFVNCYGNKFGNVWFQKISIPPPRKGSDFPGERGVNLPNFPVGRGVLHGEIFPDGSCDAY